MRVILRDVDPTTVNLEFYDEPELKVDRRYLGTLKLSKNHPEHRAFIESLRDGEPGEAVPINFAEVRYILLDRRS